jgi:hypothetical protein
MKLPRPQWNPSPDTPSFPGCAQSRPTIITILVGVKCLFDALEGINKNNTFDIRFIISSGPC